MHRVYSGCVVTGVVSYHQQISCDSVTESSPSSSSNQEKSEELFKYIFGLDIISCFVSSLRKS